MTIDKLPSGSYRVRQMRAGTVYKVMFDHKPTKAEAEQALADLGNKPKPIHDMTLLDAANEYIRSKEPVLSTTTIRGYKACLNRTDDKLLGMPLSRITQHDIQKEISRVAKDRSPKTVANHSGFLCAVLREFYPDMKISPTLPQKVKNEPYIPSDDDVKKILAEAKGTMFEIPLRLMCMGLRRSEVCALTLDDLNGTELTIGKAYVYGDGNKFVTKGTKTTESTRKIKIPPDLADMIVAQGYVYTGHPTSISDYLLRVEPKLGIPKFSPHKLRHYFCSKLIEANVDFKTIQYLGGWSSMSTINSVYGHMLDKEKKKDKAAEIIGSIIF